jgi:hypothetical protein
MMLRLRGAHGGPTPTGLSSSSHRDVEHLLTDRRNGISGRCGLLALN